MPPRSERAEYVRLSLPAEPRHLCRLRHTMNEYLSALPPTPDRRDEIVPAVGEAAANAVEHAYCHQPEPGVVDVTFWTESDAIWVEIRDYGRWREPPPGPRPPGQGDRADAASHRLRPHPPRPPRHQRPAAPPRERPRPISFTRSVPRLGRPYHGSPSEVTATAVSTRSRAVAGLTAMAEQLPEPHRTRAVPRSGRGVCCPRERASDAAGGR